ELLDPYSDLGLDEQDLVILLKLIYASETANKQPSIELLQKGSTMQPRDITMDILNFIQRELLELQVQKDEEGRFTEYMYLDPFFEKLSHILK
ncbi:DNA replication protein DnaD, partial [Staphylococcus aureus]|nr:DNA replication protein DnaD [Staphylococcus aureus]